MYDDAFTFVYANVIGIPIKIKNHSVVSNESLWNHMRFLIRFNSIRIMHTNVDVFVNFSRQWYGFLNNTDEIITMIINKYPNMDTSDKQIRGKATTQAMTDAWFAAPSNWESTAHEYICITIRSLYSYCKKKSNKLWKFIKNGL